MQFISEINVKTITNFAPNNTILYFWATNKTLMKKTILITALFTLSIFSINAQSYKAVKADAAPVVDANGSDACWEKAPWAKIDQTWIGTKSNDADFSGRYKAVWTPEQLYFLVEITDDKHYPKYPGNCNNIHNFDCIEIFLDEDRSGGDHQYNFNAFAYHIAANSDVCDLGTDRTNHLFKNDVVSVYDTLSENVYLWEVSIKVFDNTYVYGGNNTPVTLGLNKTMGMSVAYNDNDNGSTRESMFGSVAIAGADKNVSWINASYFGSVILLNDSTQTAIKSTVTNGDNLRCSWEPASKSINVALVNSNTGIWKAEVLDITGKVVMSKSIYKSGSLASDEIKVPNSRQGLYFVRMSNGGAQFCSKVIVR